ncbi:hypothetical protein [uncultured Maritimibacter sp.]|uniref:hypothetical protein n=1 Tax=uncultured Maritimibacter sp. TaxID=991866 RepID=UPI00261EA5C2|nr:hypothetical protein [uncultured Maritimibacter sp.]
MPHLAAREGSQQFRFRPHDADCVVCDLDTLRQGAQMIPPIAALTILYTVACDLRELPDHRRANGAVAGAVEQRLCPVGVGPCLIADDLEAGDAFGQSRIVQIGHPRLDGVIETLEA